MPLLPGLVSPERLITGMFTTRRYTFTLPTISLFMSDINTQTSWLTMIIKQQQLMN